MMIVVIIVIFLIMPVCSSFLVCVLVVALTFRPVLHLEALEVSPIVVFFLLFFLWKILVVFQMKLAVLLLQDIVDTLDYL